ncbi:hypothetical protein ACFP7A_01200 [Sporolactobacillus kofuensis]|uniref:Tail assembly chaperone n=1 Tax=Sporolactobacillus kofuensis TaxID=269672 RepID=A0ABW1WD45_9BACL|nr:hypothetical protein [Sporolactobacillus kofuensis]MCO7177014.1 hypothetical protein [Sporolactobacillus kofuensis]
MSNQNDVITIGGKEYIVKAVPVGKITKMFKGMSETIKELSKTDPKKIDDAITILATQFGSTVETFLRTFAPTLPEGVMDDDENGATIPELVDAFSVISKVNRLDSLLNFTKSLGLPQAAQKALQSTK